MKMSEIINQGGPEVSRYYTKCFHCGAGFIYKKNEVHRNAALNRVVGRHGYTGYTGEVHCPGCGTWLPHYEQNVYRTPAVQVTPAPETSAAAPTPAVPESLNVAASTTPAAPASEAAQAAPAEPEAENQLIPRFCAYCGHPLPSEGSFCGNCGTRIR